MYVESFSAGKNLAAPDANEDRFVVLPGRAYAVIDGVIDRTGRVYDGKSSGGVAADLIQAILERTLAAGPPGPEPEALLALVSDEIAAAYRRFGLLEQARHQPNLRFGGTLALFRHRGDFDEVMVVGDSGIRLDAERVLQVDKPLDAITAALRCAAWRAMEQRGFDVATRNRVARQVVFNGAGQDIAAFDGLLDATALARVAERAVAESAARFPRLPLEVISSLVQGGIVDGQFQHQNEADSPLGYSCVDGFAIPPRHLTIERLATGATRQVELFTDGYFEHGEKFGLAAWEAAADEVERVDPEKIGQYASVKGSQGDIRTDDRTYVGVVTG